jgi:hypothetical protein
MSALQSVLLLLSLAVLIAVLSLLREQHVLIASATHVPSPTLLLLQQQGRGAEIPRAQKPAVMETVSTAHDVSWRRALPKRTRELASWFDAPRTVDEILLEVPEGGTVWLTLANYAFRDLAINWAAHVYKLRKERSAAIAALDHTFLSTLVAERMPCLDFVQPLLRRASEDLRSNVTGFRRFGATKASLVLAFLARGREVLLSDVDVVWISDPMPSIRPFLGADVMSSTDCTSISGDEAHVAGPSPAGAVRCAYQPGNKAGHAAFNTGVLYFRATLAARAVAAAWRVMLLSVAEQAELKYVRTTEYIDDQLAFNRLIWHGFRAHPDGAVRGVGARGRIIRVIADSSLSAGVQSIQREAGDIGQRTTAPGWRSGWSQLAAASRSANTQGGAISAPRPDWFDFAPLPARAFCSGHVYWVQQGGQPHDCVSVHTTFTEGGYAGKVHRLREAHLWLLDPPSYYESPHGFLSFTPPQLPADMPLPPAVNATASRRYDDKYNSGWLVPTALRSSPRLRAHLELARRHILALRDAVAIASLLKRVLILPQLPCLCDRSESPLVLPSCISEVKAHSRPTALHSAIALHFAIALPVAIAPHSPATAVSLRPSSLVLPSCVSEVKALHLFTLP